MSWQAWLWDFFLIGGAAYVVFGLHRSPWWFLLAVILLAGSSDDKEKTKK